MIPHSQFPEAHLGYHGVYGYTIHCARHDFDYHQPRCECHRDVCPKCMEEQLELNILLDALDEILDRLESIDQTALDAGTQFKYRLEEVYQKVQGGNR